ncbi:PREDICTED: all-trans retinoic acid-induced differentiation factor isoform X2 [Nanorana parkeri]|uniref:all-trans retinoic acid-induced differentiation factor isoform X2 n=1 Tax=Nanorana parkeri TaxID=125878 RepID=UPI0008545054|nr:PREDICTED: all-trans retinoic acid-induced differentiation factor isoform X2 [Nanorana parkeri]
MCPGTLRNSSEVSHLCSETSEAELVGRCCVKPPGGDIIGLDLWNCSISHLDPGLRLTAAIVVIDISQNPLQELPREIFQGLTGLNYLALPVNISCPGGNQSWASVETGSEGRICRDQQSSCNSTGDVVLCPENSLCAPDGPGYTQCVCVAGFSGYKCLREGSFPMIMFFGILSSVTIVLAIFFWCTQRKKVKSL